MKQRILLSAQELRSIQSKSDCVIVDCRFSLNDADAGYKKYLDAHIPGAAYAHLDDDLSSQVTATSGRHPLPDADKFATFLSQAGWRPGLMMAVYDDVGGAIAARLWWLMKYFGHDGACMLNGGIAEWQKEGYELESGGVSTIHQPVENLAVRSELVMPVSNIAENLEGSEITLVDARANERFTGKVEPLDTVAGHIPGSVNYPYSSNLDENGMFKAADDIRCEMLGLAEKHGTQNLVHMCGSGVTACHNIFAAELVGLKGSRLYVGSWSEWIRDQDRPVETGAG